MPKLKTRKTAKKRFKKTASGKIKAYKKGRNHLRSKKNNRRQNRLKGNQVLSKTAQKRAKKAANLK